MTDNPFLRWQSTDVEHCVPLLNQAGFTEILQQVAIRVGQGMGRGPTPKAFLDLEQLQVTDYGALDGVSAEQQQFIARLHAKEPVRPEDMIFLALRSLFQFAWPQPESQDDIRYADAYDHVLNMRLADAALDLAKAFTSPTALLPYWGRLAFLSIMGELPTENIARFGLGRVSCTLVKKTSFNATTFMLEDGPVIGISYALQPLLKHLNRYLLHYFGSREMAGPQRLSRAWAGIVPTVLHFWSGSVSAPQLTRSSSFLYEEDMAAMSHQLTVRQVEFIIMHELGHVALDHPRRVPPADNHGNDAKVLRHEFEFAADGFALGVLQSMLLKKLRDRTPEPGEDAAEAKPGDPVGAALRDCQRGLGAAHLLFIYMDFVQRAGELLRDRLGEQLGVLERMDTHPRASERLERLDLTSMGDHTYTSPIQRYAQAFLPSVLDYAASLDDEDLLASVTSALA